VTRFMLAGGLLVLQKPLVGGKHSVTGGRQKSSSGGQSSAPRPTGTFGGRAPVCGAGSALSGFNRRFRMRGNFADGAGVPGRGNRI
jgi:hypothetical protein